MEGLFKLCFLVLLAVGFNACSNKRNVEQDINKDVAVQATGIAEGKTLFVACGTCHGELAQGNPHLHAPALTNLDGWYLYTQLMNFKKGIRGYLAKDTLGSQMAAMTVALKDSIAVSHVVAYISTLPQADPINTLTGDIKKGERSYQSICGACHGPQGKGNEAMQAPRLNGLDDWYLKSQLLKFQDGARGAHPQDHLGAQMVSMADLLKDDQSINDVIVYLRSVTKPVVP